MIGSIGDFYSDYYTQNDAGSVKASALEHKLNHNDLQGATDEELMEACKEFEAYLVEQVMKQVQESIPKSEEEEDNKYLDYFGDMMLQEYSSIITERGDLGIAQSLYEGMKNNMHAVNMKQADTSTETVENAQEAVGAAQNINM